MPRRRGWKKSLAVKTVRQKTVDLVADVNSAVGIVPQGADPSVSAGEGIVPMDVGIVPTSEPLATVIPSAMPPVSAGMVIVPTPVTGEATSPSEYHTEYKSEYHTEYKSEYHTEYKSEYNTLPQNKAQDSVPKFVPNNAEKNVQRNIQNKNVEKNPDFSLENESHGSKFQSDTIVVEKNQLPFNASFLRFGSFDQFSERFSAEFRGSQCTCMALSYLLSCLIDRSPQLLDLDQILIYGDEMYQSQINKLKTSNRFRSMLLSLEEIPDEILYQNKRFEVVKEDIQIGQTVNTDVTSDLPSLQLALANSFQLSNSALLVTGAICSALFLDSDALYLFDSHSHGKSTLNEPFLNDGKSIIIGFSSLDELVQYLYSFYTSIHIDLNSQFEVLPIHFIERSVTSLMDGNLKKYLNDQKRRSELLIEQKKTSVNRKSPAYHREYMRLRRQNQTLRNIEKERDLLAKQQKRTNEEFKQKELEDKRKKREDDEFKQTRTRP